MRQIRNSRALRRMAVENDQLRRSGKKEILRFVMSRVWESRPQISAETVQLPTSDVAKMLHLVVSHFLSYDQKAPAEKLLLQKVNEEMTNQ